MSSNYVRMRASLPVQFSYLIRYALFAYFPRSTAHVKAEDSTVYIAFQGRRFSVDFSFLHSPPPRHMRLGWPATESFDNALRGFSTTSAEVEQTYLREGVMPGEPGGSLMGTNLVLCTMFKNEAAYLEEWLQYHQLLGVSKVRDTFRI